MLGEREKKHILSFPNFISVWSRYTVRDVLYFCNLFTDVSQPSPKAQFSLARILITYWETCKNMASTILFSYFADTVHPLAHEMGEKSLLSLS